MTRFGNEGSPFHPRATRGTQLNELSEVLLFTSTPARCGAHRPTAAGRVPISLQPPRNAGRTAIRERGPVAFPFKPRATRGALLVGHSGAIRPPSTPAQRGALRHPSRSVRPGCLQPPRSAGRDGAGEPVVGRLYLQPPRNAGRTGEVLILQRPQPFNPRAMRGAYRAGRDPRH